MNVVYLIVCNWITNWHKTWPMTSTGLSYRRGNLFLQHTTKKHIQWILPPVPDYNTQSTHNWLCYNTTGRKGYSLSQWIKIVWHYIWDPTSLDHWKDNLLFSSNSENMRVVTAARTIAMHLATVFSILTSFFFLSLHSMWHLFWVFRYWMLCYST